MGLLVRIRYDLPVWQGLYEELKDKNFTIIAVALDSAGAPAVRDFIRPASLELPPMLQDIMGWDDAFMSRAGVPQYPCLIDQKHITGELYEFINVPMNVWIDEKGHIVRPTEPPAWPTSCARSIPRLSKFRKMRWTRASGCAAPITMRSATGSPRASAANSFFLPTKPGAERPNPMTPTRWRRRFSD